MLHYLLASVCTFDSSSSRNSSAGSSSATTKLIKHIVSIRKLIEILPPSPPNMGWISQQINVELHVSNAIYYKRIFRRTKKLIYRK